MCQEISRLFKMGYKINHEDLPDYLDFISKNYLLKVIIFNLECQIKFKDRRYEDRV